MRTVLARKSGSSTTVRMVIYHIVSQELSPQYASKMHLGAQVQTCRLTAPGCEAFLSEPGVFEPYDTVGAYDYKKI